MYSGLCSVLMVCRLGNAQNGPKETLSQVSIFPHSAFESRRLTIFIRNALNVVLDGGTIKEAGSDQSKFPPLIFYCSNSTLF